MEWHASLRRQPSRHHGAVGAPLRQQGKTSIPGNRAGLGAAQPSVSHNSLALGQAEARLLQDVSPWVGAGLGGKLRRTRLCGAGDQPCCSRLTWRPGTQAVCESWWCLQGPAKELVQCCAQQTPIWRYRASLLPLLDL